MKNQDSAQYIMYRLSQKLRNHAKLKGFRNQKDFQDDISKNDIEFTQSVLSRLLNSSYPIKNEDNKIFKDISKYFELAPQVLWNELMEGYEESFDINESDEKLNIGLTSFASWTAPIFHTLIDTDDFPNWLRLTHTYTPDDTGNYVPNWIENSRDIDNSIDDIVNENIKKERNPFLGLYTSTMLPPMLLHPNRNEASRCLHGIFSPDKTVESRCIKQEGDVFTLEDGNQLAKIATLVEGFGGLLCVVRLLDSSNESDKEIIIKITEEDKAVGYKIEHHRLNKIEVQDENLIEGNFYNFLDLLKEIKKEKIKKKIEEEEIEEEIEKKEIGSFILRGIKNSAIFDSFKDFLSEQYEVETQKEVKGEDEKKRREEEDKRDLNKKIIHNLKKKRDTLSFDSEDSNDYKNVGEALRRKEKLVLVGYSPFLHNIFRAIRQAANFQKEEYIILERFNLSQWIGKTSCSLYIVKEHFTPKNFSKINQFLERLMLKSKKLSIASNDKLPKFYFMTGNDENSIIEANSLYVVACKEMGLDKPVNISYSPSLIQLLLDSY